MSDPRLNLIPFWYLRHGETDWNAENLSQGTVDIPLNQTGLAQARSASLLLRNRGIRSIMSSPLSRARRTAEIAGAELGLPIEIENDLHEVAFGVQEGKPMGNWYPSWVAGEFTPSGAEPFEDLKTRAIAAVNRCTTRPTPTLIVAHGALFRAVRSAMGLDANIRTKNAVPMFCDPPRTPSDPWTVTDAD